MRVVLGGDSCFRFSLGGSPMSVQCTTEEMLLFGNQQGEKQGRERRVLGSRKWCAPGWRLHVNAP